MSWTVDGLTYNLRKKITIQNANIDSDQTDFPVYVDITSDTDIGAVSNADGFDIRFTQSDGSTLLKYEREAFSITGGSATGHFWVKTNITTASTTNIYIYYRSTDTADGADPTNVWDANFAGVWHMKEASWNGTAGEVKDSTSNANNGTATNATIIAGKIGNSGDFDGTGDYVTVPSHASLSITGAITLSAWINRDAHQDFGHPIHKPYAETTWDSPYSDYGFEWGYTGGGTQNTLDWMTCRSTTITHKTATANYTDAWFYAAGKFTGSNVYIQINETMSGATAVSGNINASGRSLIFGAGTADGDFPFNGAVDEVRISNIARADAWLKFEYYNMNEADNELTWGAEDTGGTTVNSNFFQFF